MEKFYLYNHLSTDNFQEVLQPYIDNGIVELKHAKGEPKNKMEWDAIQVSSYKQTIDNVKNEVEWLIIVDTDEFLYPVQKNSLPEVLKEYDDYPALSVVWKIFGSNNVDSLSDGELMIEKLTTTSAWKNGQAIKSIVKPRYVENVKPIHFPVLKDGYVQIDEKKEYFEGYNPPNPTLNILRINHYWARDLKFFYERKMNRAHVKPRTKEEKQILMNMNKDCSEVEDTMILRFVPLLKEKLKGH